MAQEQAQTTSCEALAANLSEAQASLSALRNTILSFKGRVDSGGFLTWKEVNDLIDITCRAKRALVMANAFNLPSQCGRKQLDQYITDLRALDETASALENRLVLSGDLRWCRPVTLPDGTQRPVGEKSPIAKQTVAALRSEEPLLSGGNGFRI